MAEKRVLITGASSGIGYASACLLANHGYRVFAAVRSIDDTPAYPDSVVLLKVDITSAEDRQAAAALIDKECGENGLFGLVNNAGVPKSGPAECVDIDELKEVFDINFFGPLMLTQRLLPSLRRAQGRVVNVSSIAGRIAAPFFSPYAASKHALEAMSDALRVEVNPVGIHVSIVEPGAIQSKAWKKSDDDFQRELANLSGETRELYYNRLAGVANFMRNAEQRGLPPEQAATVVLKALNSAKPKTRYPVGLEAKIKTQIIHRLFPDRLKDRMFLRILKRHS